MTTCTTGQIQVVIGTAFEGGFYAGRLQIDGQQYALIVSPRAKGETTGKWGEYCQDVPGARSYNDGRANTLAMAKAGSTLAQWALSLNIGGHTDWYIPGRDELEILYRNLKPTNAENYAEFRVGDNASSLPTGYPYTEESPAQTPAEAFQEGQPEAIEPNWHWASTQYSPYLAYAQCLDEGYQATGQKDDEILARAVRKIPITN